MTRIAQINSSRVQVSLWRVEKSRFRIVSKLTSSDAWKSSFRFALPLSVILSVDPRHIRAIRVGFWFSVPAS
jgi:hypothetical protein